MRESRARLLLLEIAYEVSLSGDMLASGEHVLLSSHERIQQFVAIHGEAPHDPSRPDDCRTYARSAPYVLLIGQFVAAARVAVSCCRVEGGHRTALSRLDEFYPVDPPGPRPAQTVL